MIEGLMTCLLIGKAEERKAQVDGHRFVSACVRVQVGGDWLFGNVVTSNAAAGATLLALRDGEAIALAGTLSPRAWLDGDGDPRIILEILAHAALTVRDAKHGGRRSE
jgi:hypothetical protein